MILYFVQDGQIPEWPKGTDCKSAANCFGGSNPPLPMKKTHAKACVFFCNYLLILRAVDSRSISFGRSNVLLMEI